jgi:hypothetical protein
MIRAGDGIDVIMIWSTKGSYGTGGDGQGPGRSAGHRDEGMGEEKGQGLIAGGSARRSTHNSALPLVERKPASELRLTKP